MINAPLGAIVGPEDDAVVPGADYVLRPLEHGRAVFRGFVAPRAQRIIRLADGAVVSDAPTGSGDGVPVAASATATVAALTD